MIETDPLTIAQFATDAAAVLMQGPPGGLPSPVPDFVGELLGTIQSFVDGSIDHLGSAVREVTPGGSGNAPGH